MKKFMWAIVCSAAVASPVFAHDEGMAADSITCAEFLAMDADGRTQAVEAVQMAPAEGGMASDDMASGGMASDDMASGDMASGDMASGDMASGDMASGDMASGDMASGDMASDDMASGEMMESDQMASGDAMMESDQMASGDAMMAEDTVAAVLEVCKRDPNVRLADAMEEATGH